jgi:hypothetical protein
MSGEAPDELVHTLCGNNVKRYNTSRNEGLVNCTQCMKALAKRDCLAAQAKPELSLTPYPIILHVSSCEFAAVMAGLRLLQETVRAQQSLDPDIEEIFTRAGTITPLGVSPFVADVDEFDSLCARINSESGHGPN